MGNQGSTSATENFKDGSLAKFSDVTEFVSDRDDPSFADIKIYRRINSPEEQLIAVKTRVFNDKEQFDLLNSECQLRITFTHKNILELLGYQFQVSQDICGSVNKCNLFYEFYDHDLEKEISKRSKKSEFFNESEIWYIIESIISAGYFFQENGIFHGDLRPQHILLTTNGFVKIADHGIIHPNKNGYIKTLIQSEHAYLSPLLMSALNKKENDPIHNEFKSDVWSLGLTILESATLVSTQRCYDWQKETLLLQNIQDLLNQAATRYTPSLIQTIRQLLEMDEASRPDFKQLYAQYLQNQNQGVEQQSNRVAQQNQQNKQQTQSFQGTRNVLTNSFGGQQPQQQQQQQQQPQLQTNIIPGQQYYGQQQSIKQPNLGQSTNVPQQTISGQQLIGQPLSGQQIIGQPIGGQSIGGQQPLSGQSIPFQQFGGQPQISQQYNPQQIQQIGTQPNVTASPQRVVYKTLPQTQQGQIQYNPVQNIPYSQSFPYPQSQQIVNSSFQNQLPTNLLASANPSQIPQYQIQQQYINPLSTSQDRSPQTIQYQNVNNVDQIIQDSQRRFPATNLQ